MLARELALIILRRFIYIYDVYIQRIFIKDKKKVTHARVCKNHLTSPLYVYSSPPSLPYIREIIWLYPADDSNNKWTKIFKSLLIGIGQARCVCVCKENACNRCFLTKKGGAETSALINIMINDTLGREFHILGIDIDRCIISHLSRSLCDGAKRAKDSLSLALESLPLERTIYIFKCTKILYSIIRARQMRITQVVFHRPKNTQTTSLTTNNSSTI